MKFNVRASDLLRELDPIARVADRKQTIPVLRYVLVEAKATGLVLHGTDLSVRLSCRCEANVQAEGVALFQAARLRDLANLADNQAVIDVLVEGETGHVEVDGYKAKLNLLPTDEFPNVLREAPVERVTVSSDALAAMLRQVDYCTPAHVHKAVIPAAELRCADGKIMLRSTDGYRAGVATANCSGAAAIACLVPKLAIRDLIGFLAGTKEASIASTDDRLFVFAGDRQFVATLLDGQMANIDRVTPTDPVKGFTVDAESLLAGFQRVGLVVDQVAELRPMRVEFSEQAIEISGETMNVGQGVERIVPISAFGGDCGFKINARFIFDFLSASAKGPVSLDWKSAAHPIVMTQQGESPTTYKQVIVPIIQ